MGDHQQRLSLGEGHDGPLDLILILRIREGGGLVQNDDGSILQDGTGNGDALAFPAGELLSRVPRSGVPAVFQTADELFALGCLGGREHLLV